MASRIPRPPPARPTLGSNDVDRGQALLMAKGLEIDDPETLCALMLAGREGEWFEADRRHRVRLTEFGWKVFHYQARGRRKHRGNRGAPQATVTRGSPA